MIVRSTSRRQGPRRTALPARRSLQTLIVPRPPTRPTKSHVALSDIARDVGVSTATVSRVINNRGHIAPATRERVLRAVRRHNYYPNAHARGLASGRSSLVGLVISDISNPFFPELVTEIESAAFEHGLEVILANTRYDPQRVTSYVRRFIERGVRGVAIMTSEFDRALAAELARRDVSVVCFDSGRPGPHMSYLVVDYQTGIDQAIAHLVAHGHRRIAFIGGPSEMRSSQQRLLAFMRSVERQLGAGPARVFDGDYRFEGGRRAARAMLKYPTRQSAVVVANDMMALGVLHECRATGVSVPGDLSVIGFDDIALAALSYPSLTTVSLSRHILGRGAVEALLATLDHPERTGIAVPVPTALVVRDSAGPARQAPKAVRRRR
jgi:DNA-binding LacI/PurR family transcriptional regulator